MLHIPQITLDWISFAIGFVSACILFLIIWGIRRLTGGLRSSLRETNKSFSTKKHLGFKEAYLRSLMNRTLRQHLAFQLFSLEEILVEPRVMVPPSIVDPRNPPLTDRITDRWIPYIPEHPEIISQYGISTLSLEDAIQFGGNFFLYGRPGTGKSVALTALALRCTKQDPALGSLSKLLPIFLHVAEIDLLRDADDPLDLLKEAILILYPKKVHNELIGLLESYLQAGDILLLLDGLDELSNIEIEHATTFLEKLKKAKPEIRVVTTAFGNGFEFLARIGFEPLVLSAWGPRQVEQLVDKWYQHWLDVKPDTNAEGIDQKIDKRILFQWLLSEQPLATPLEWTLKIWSFLANDAHSSYLGDLVSDYFERLQSSCKTKDLEACSVKMVNDKTSSLLQSEFRKKVSGEALSVLVANGFLDQYRNDWIKFSCPVFAGYFARNSIQPISRSSVQEALDWSIKYAQYYFHEEPDLGEKMISAIDIESEAPIYSDILSANRWFIDAKRDQKTRSIILKTLYSLIRKEELPLSIRLALVTACVLHADGSIQIVLRQLIKSGSPIVKQTTAVAIGGIRDERFITDLLGLVSDPDMEVRGAALLALSQFNKASATNVIIDALMTGEENLKLLAAEALTNNLPVGHEILKQSARSKDFMVRRSAVIAIGHISADWVVDFLNQVSVEDDQWIVRNAAANALETLQSPSLHAPKPLPKASEAEWLIQCASDREVGIPVGKVPVSLLLDIVKTGGIEEQLAALDYLKNARDKNIAHALLDVTRDVTSAIREKAIYSLWFLERSGMTIRSDN